jgi:glutamate carboxypeptidase
MDETRAKLLSLIDHSAEEQLGFLIELCEQNSFTRYKRGSDTVAQMILSRLDGILPHRVRIEQVEVGDHHVLRNRPESPAIYLVGHMDTVFPPDHPFQRCHLDGEVLAGPGTADMKGGLAVIVYALKALAGAGLVDQLSLALVLNADEEIGSVTSSALFRDEAKRAVACLVAECAGVNGEVVVSRNGKLGAAVRCSGRDRHVAAVESGKSSAILELAHKIIAIEALNGAVPGTSLNVGKVEGGLGPATVPKSARCLLDVRWRSEQLRADLLERINRVIAVPVQPGCETEMEILNSRPAMPMGKGALALLQLLENVAKELGQEVRPEHRNGTSDANFFGSQGVPTLDGIGPIGDRDHTAKEFIRVPSLRGRTALLASFLVELAQARGTFA